MTITFEVLRKKVEKAKKYLMDRHIIAIDGSGEPSIEELLVILGYLQRGDLLLVHESKPNKP